MVSAPLAVVVTILFAGAALFSIVRLTKAHGPVTRANYVLHLLMSLAMMAAMTLMVLSMQSPGPELSAMSHGGGLDAGLTAAGGFFAVAVVMWAVVLVRRIRGVPASRLRTNLAGDAAYELAMAAGMVLVTALRSLIESSMAHGAETTDAAPADTPLRGHL